MPKVLIHKDYSKKEFAYKDIAKAWNATNGKSHFGRCFFIAQLITPSKKGEWMAYMRWPDKKSELYIDRPFEYEGFSEEGEAENAIWERVQNLGWRIERMDSNMLPTKVSKDLLGFL